MKMKVLLTVHQFLPEHASGTEVLTYSVAQELRRRGHDVSVFTAIPTKSKMPEEDRFDHYIYEGISVHRFHHDFIPLDKLDATTEVEYCNLRAASYFERLIESIKPDIIHYFHLSRLGAALIDAGIAAGIPAFFTPTDFWSVCPTCQLLLENGEMCQGPTGHGGNCVKHVALLTQGKRIKTLMKLTPEVLIDLVAGMTVAGRLPSYPMSKEVSAMSKRRAFIVKRLNALQKVIAPTQLMRDVLVRNGVYEEKISKSAYGIDISYYQNTTRKESETFTIGFIGTLAPHKGCHVLIKAVARIKDRSFRLRIYGKPSDFPQYFEQLQALAKDVPQVEFMGTFPNRDIGSVLAGFDTLVVPSLWYENTPLVVYSAMAAACPVVASDFPGMAEIVKNGVNGLTFKPGSEDELGASLLRLMSEEGLLLRLRNQCKQPKSTIEYVDELLVLYEEGKKVTPPMWPEGEWLSIPDLSAQSESGGRQLIGWAIAHGSAPKAVRLRVGNRIVADVSDFYPRADVSQGFRNYGITAKTQQLGFTLTLPRGGSCVDAILEVVDKHGVEYRIACTELPQGSSKAMAKGVFIGADITPWQSQQTMEHG
jgi:glycosyltransferase involved in cell wall biosynthesis